MRTYHKCVGDMVTKKALLFWSTLDKIQSPQASMANVMAINPSKSSHTPSSSAVHLHSRSTYKMQSKEIIFLWKEEDIHTYRSLTFPCLHHKYVLKIKISALAHSDACSRSSSGAIILSLNLWFTGSSEFDLTRSGTQWNSTVALYSWIEVWYSSRILKTRYC